MSHAQTRRPCAPRSAVGRPCRGDDRGAAGSRARSLPGPASYRLDRGAGADGQADHRPAGRDRRSGAARTARPGGAISLGTIRRRGRATPTCMCMRRGTRPSPGIGPSATGSGPIPPRPPPMRASRRGARPCIRTTAGPMRRARRRGRMGWRRRRCGSGVNPDPSPVGRRSRAAPDEGRVVEAAKPPVDGRPSPLSARTTAAPSCAQALSHWERVPGGGARRT